METNSFFFDVKGILLLFIHSLCWLAGLSSIWFLPLALLEKQHDTIQWVEENKETITAILHIHQGQESEISRQEERKKKKNNRVSLRSLESSRASVEANCNLHIRTQRKVKPGAEQSRAGRSRAAAVSICLRCNNTCYFTLAWAGPARKAAESFSRPGYKYHVV